MADRRAGYLPALDGVRGLLMLLFMAYHLGASQLQGAWIGINLFFILSAFLIVRLLVIEHDRHGDIDVLGFYRRRARRLLPALLLVLAAVSVWWGLLGEGEVRRRLGGDVLATLGYVINWRLIAQSDEYFGDRAGASPLRHAWSLAIEEQFYLLVPLLVIALLMLLGRRRLVAVAVLAAATVLATLWTASVAGDPGTGFARLYYGTDTRAQSLLLGAALGLWSAPRAGRRPIRSLPGGLLLAMGAVGLIVTLVGLVVISPEAPWMYQRGGILLLGLAAAALVLACADDRGSPLTRALGRGPLAHTGRLAYGLYLWHWPVALILLDLLGSDGPVNIVLGTAVSYLLAHLSYTYVERPVIARGVRGLLPTRRPALVGALPVAAVTAVGLVLVGTAPASPAEQPVAPARDLVAGQPEHRPGQPSRIAVRGDSVPYYLARDFSASAAEGVQIDNLAATGCDLLPEPAVVTEDLLLRDEDACARLRETWPTTFEERGDQVLLLFGSPLLILPHRIDGETIGLDDPAYRRAITDRLDTLREQAYAAGAEQVQLVNLPCRRSIPQGLPAEMRDALEENAEFRAEYQDPVQVNAILEDWADRYDDVALLDLDGALCADGPREQVGGQTVYGDDLHFSEEITPTVWRWLLGQVSQEYAARER